MTEGDEPRPAIPRFSRGLPGTIASQVAGTLASAGSTIVVARWLGPSGQGLIALGLLLPGTLGLLLNAGQEVANIHFAGRRSVESSDLFSTSVVFALLGGGAAAVIVGGLAAAGLLARIVPHLPVVLLVLGLLTLPFSVLDASISGLLRGLHRVAAVNLLDLVQPLVGLALTVALVVGLGFGPTAVLAAALFAVSVSVMGRAMVLRKGGVRLRVAWNPRLLRLIGAFGGKSSVGNAMQYLTYRLDVFFVNIVVGSAGVGRYTVAFRIAELLWLVPYAAGLLILPRAASLPVEETNRLTPRAFWLTFFVSVAAAAALSAVGLPLLKVFFSAKFAPAYHPLLLLLPGVAILGPATVLANEIAGRGYPQYNAGVAVVTLVVALTSYSVLIPRYALAGAAVGSSIAYSVSAVVTLVVYLKVTRCGIRRFLLAMAWWRTLVDH